MKGATRTGNAFGHRRTPDFARVAEAFDHIAGSFDVSLENAITKRLRRKIYSIITSLVRPGSTLLDVNCGTGIDLMELTRQGYRVYGTDVSEKMIATARSKFRHEPHIQDRLVVSSFDQLSPTVVPAADLAFSNFGGLNCTPDIERAAQAIRSVIQPGGYFVGVIMSPFSLWESLSYAARWEWSRVFRRTRTHVLATGFPGTTFPVYYYSPQRISAAFGASFARKSIVGLSVLSPTPQATNFLKRYPRLSGILFRTDDFVERLPLFRAMGDHFAIVLRKKQ